ncbi:MAG: hypothetical protein AAGD11_15650 [Planctomycetota bacterium]
MIHGRSLAKGLLIGATAVFALARFGVLHAQESESAGALLEASQWQQIDRSVESGLSWLAGQQQRDGSFPTLPQGQPGVTSLCIMAFLSHGHLPGEGPYGDQLQLAVDYVLGCQKRSGMLAFISPNGVKLSRNVSHVVGSTAAYNHAISGLVLSETYGIQGERPASKVRPAIRRALDVTLQMQKWRKDNPNDLGGWRYVLDMDADDSDVSITGWHLMFLRSAKNAGFDIAKEPIDEAVGYVRRCFRPRSSTFAYTQSPMYSNYTSRGVTGAGILALAHAGLHDTPESQQAGDWLLQNRFDQYNNNPVYLERYHYGLLTCSQAMYQLGGRHWQQFFPSTAITLVGSQLPDGSWPRESHHRDGAYGSAYSSAICLITLGTPNDLLPIFQR